MKSTVKRIFAVILCIVLSVSFGSSVAWAAKLDEDELPVIVIGPVRPALNRKLIVSAPDSWEEIFAYTWAPESFGQFPGMRISKQGNVFLGKIAADTANLILSAPDQDGSYRQTAELHLENNGKEVAVIIAEDGSVRICYGTTGDVTGDGKLNIGDPGKLYSHLSGSKPLSDTATLLFADFTGDGRVNMGDVAKLYAHIRAS